MIDGSWFLHIPEKVDCTLMTMCWVGHTVIDSGHLYPEKFKIALFVPKAK